MLLELAPFLLGRFPVLGFWSRRPTLVEERPVVSDQVFVEHNGNVGYQNCPNAPIQHAVRRASLSAATRLVGKPTRTGGALSAEERKRRGSKLLLGKPSQPSPLAGVSCIRRARLTILPAQEAVTRGT